MLFSVCYLLHAQNPRKLAAPLSASNPANQPSVAHRDPGLVVTPWPERCDDLTFDQWLFLVPVNGGRLVA